MKEYLDDNKKFKKPTLEIIDFVDEDIITESGDFGEGSSQGGDDWHNGGF